MKITIHGVFLVLFSIFQATWINYIEIFNIKPNLFLIYVIIVCCFCGCVEGGTVGFAFGLALDLLIGRVWGLNALLGLICGFFVSHFCDKAIRNNNVFIVCIFTFLGTIVFETIYYVVSLLFVENLGFLTAFFKIVLPESLYNAVIAIPVYFLFSKLAKRLYVDKGEIIG